MKISTHLAITLEVMVKQSILTPVIGSLMSSSEVEGKEFMIFMKRQISKSI